MMLGENIRRLRSANGMSQDELAERLGVSRQSVSKWENGSATPELDKLAAMAEIFHVTLDSLVYGGPPEPPSASGPDAPEPPERQRRRGVREIVGKALIAVGLVWLPAVVIFLTADLLLACLVVLPLILCGAACLWAKRLTFWCLASVYGPFFVYVQIFAGLSLADIEVMMRGLGNPVRGEVLLAFIAVGLAITILGVFAFRDVRVSLKWYHVLAVAALIFALWVPLNYLSPRSFYSLRVLVALKYLLAYTLVVYGSVLVRSLVSSMRTAKE